MYGSSQNRLHGGSPQSYPHAPVWVPEEASDARLIFASIFDGALAIAGGAALTVVVMGFDLTDLLAVPFVILYTLGLSFTNHVWGSVLFRGSIGKHLLGLRVVRAKDGGRPRFWRSILRWLVGFVMFVIMVLAEDWDGIGQACGLRTVLRRDLAANSLVAH
ncbi:RDD family protein [Nocardia vinacea]|uniref:RDD family protein n=1 Tax=Nocardia vinacea TaxID=96468 RepID=A0ABZ1ZBI5_9NOCA|nr:RDD family protein [Nocardia vinacea]